MGHRSARGGAGGAGTDAADVAKDLVPTKKERLEMRLVPRESSKNEPRNELDSLVTSLVETRFYECARVQRARHHAEQEGGREGALEYTHLEVT